MPIIKHQDKRQRVILRTKVLKVVEATKKHLTGREIAKRARLEYKQTIDALDALYNAGRVQRHGKKFLTMWSRVEEAGNQDLTTKFFNDAFDIMTKKRQRENG